MELRQKRKYIKSGKPRKQKVLTDLSSLPSLPFRITELKILPGTHIGMALRQARKSLGVSASAVARAMDYDEHNINHFNGEWDNEALLKVGLLTTDTEADIITIIKYYSQ